MSRHRSDDSVGAGITSAGDFRAALEEVLTEADENDVDVHGGWPVASGDEPAWDVEITPLSKQTTHQAADADEFPIEAILTAVASRKGVQKDELPPLQRSIDVDSITQVYADLGEKMQGEVTFEYCNYTISVYADGQITIDG